MKIMFDTDWFAMIKDLSPEKKEEVIQALMDYPNGKSSTSLWQKIILPNLEKGRIAYYNKIATLKQNKKSATEATDTEGKTRTIHNTELTVQDKPITTEPARQAENKKAFENAIAQIAGANTGADAVVEKRIAQDGTVHEGIAINNKTLLAFVKHRFPRKTTDRVSNWAIEHNDYGKKYTTTSLIKLLTKFQTDSEPGIDYHKTMAEYIEFARQNESV